jgi:hypothetical protein
LLEVIMKSNKKVLAVRRGFALVVTLALMMLLTVIAVGLLSLSTIALRSSGQGEAMATARANARLALMLALGELQKAAGDDRRVTVDGSIFDGAKNPNVLGVWKSWSPRLAEDPTASAPDYGKKDQQFVAWLASSVTPSDLAAQNWAKNGTLANPTPLFSEKSDGFLLTGSKIDVKNGTRFAGALAWAVVQDATRAKINVSGPEISQRLANADLQAQPRPSLAKSESFKQPAGEWNKRSTRVISMAQAKLDADLWKASPPTPEGAHFTSQGYGLLTDPVNGGLKTDLSLGFEMSDSDFQKDTWGTFKNPFRSANAPRVNTPASYRGERPLFEPLTAFASVHVDLNFPPANTVYEFPAAAVPTFATLRSFYRTPYHVYGTADGPTIFERGMDHVALKQPVTAGGRYVSPGATPPAQKSQTSYRPVLDRVLYVLSVGLSANPNTLNEIRLIITPIVTLWNPYNVALEIEGAVMYPWMDMAYYPLWKIYQNGKETFAAESHLAGLLATQFVDAGNARSVNPYFFASITPDGTGTAGGGKSIRFQPGEVRVFVPADPVAKEFVATDSIRKRTLYLRPVDSLNQGSLRGGFAVPTRNPKTGGGFSRVLANTESLQVSFSTHDWYPFGVGLEDATRAKLSDPGVADRGQSVSDVQTTNFINSGATATLTSSLLTFNALSNPATRQPFGMLETYHRVANDSAAYRRSDLVYTTNPRQAHINRFLTTGSFFAGPHYETRMTALANFNQVIQTANAGRSAYYGATNSAGSGMTHLVFFEVPRSPLLSLAALQHADLAGTSYSPANQFANSWASAYLRKQTVAKKIPAATITMAGADAGYTRAEMPVYDYSYLANESIWDSFFFSGAAASLQPGTAIGSPSVWNTDVAEIKEDYQKTLEKFIDDPANNSLRNPRMRFHAGNAPASTLKNDLLGPQGCLRLAAHLQVDGAFNINSTSEKAWIGILSGMKDLPLELAEDPKSAAKTQSSSLAQGNIAYSRFRNPVGTENNPWLGFRSLTDTQVEELARKLVLQVRKRGPFLSLGEFVNRRIENSNLGLKGAVQAAIDEAGFNSASLYDTFDTTGFPSEGKSNISPNNTGVGIPGYLTQADVLQSIAPVMTVRSDTFTIRGYGEAKDSSGKVLVTSWCEAVVQRTPEFVDASDSPHTAIAGLNQTNQTFGRKFTLVSFRYLAGSELGL